MNTTPEDAAHVTPQDTAYITPEDAARTLNEIRTSQARLIRSRPWFPAWYTTGVALYVTGIQFLTEPGTPVAATSTGIAVLTLALAALVLTFAFRTRHRPHRALVTWKILAIFATWLATAIALCLVLALALSDISYARTYAALAMTAYMTATGPLIARHITNRMAATIEAAR
ncbi:hypothetical protein ABGB17_17815 [Sphaerisporangium sp. B11E5]|uniref:hypothetical protein n=1 Tax=Sphaerisporangium sp. B11E5 TaxID=3153563 RepID=UPI00325F1A70